MQVECRAADDLEHVGGGGLLLQRFGKFFGALLHLVEQPHVLDRDHRLVGEGGQQLNLPFRKRDGFRFANRNRADRFAVAQHGNRHRGAPIPCQSKFVGIRRVREHIGHMGDRAVQDRPSRRQRPVGPLGIRLQKPIVDLGVKLWLAA